MSHQPIIDHSKEWSVHALHCRMAPFSKQYTRHIFFCVDQAIRNQKDDLKKTKDLDDKQLEVYNQKGLTCYSKTMETLCRTTKVANLIQDFEKTYGHYKIHLFIQDAHFLSHHLYPYFMKATPQNYAQFYSKSKSEELKTNFFRFYFEAFHMEIENELAKFFHEESLCPLGFKASPQDKFEIHPHLFDFFSQSFNKVHDFSIRSAVQSIVSFCSEQIYETLLPSSSTSTAAVAETKKEEEEISLEPNAIVLDLIAKKIEWVQKKQEDDLKAMLKQREEDLKGINQQLVKERELLLSISQKWTDAIKELKLFNEQKFQAHQMSLLEIERNIQRKVTDSSKELIESSYDSILFFIKNQTDSLDESLFGFVKELKKAFPNKHFSMSLGQSFPEYDYQAYHIEEDQPETEEEEEEEEEEVEVEEEEEEKREEKETEKKTGEIEKDTDKKVSDMSISWKDPRLDKGLPVLNPIPPSFSINPNNDNQDQDPHVLSPFFQNKKNHSSTLRGWVVFALAPWCFHCKEKGIEVFAQATQILPALFSSPVSWIKSDKFELISKTHCEELQKMRQTLQGWPSVYFFKLSPSDPTCVVMHQLEKNLTLTNLVKEFQAFLDPSVDE